MTWQPISTAPKDGNFVILFDPEFPYVMQGVWIRDEEEMRLYEGSRIGWNWSWNSGEQCNPTHWMPLPDPPPATVRDCDGRLCREAANGDLIYA